MLVLTTDPKKPKKFQGKRINHSAVSSFSVSPIVNQSSKPKPNGNQALLISLPGNIFFQDHRRNKPTYSEGVVLYFPLLMIQHVTCNFRPTSNRASVGVQDVYNLQLHLKRRSTRLEAELLDTPSRQAINFDDMLHHLTHGLLYLEPGDLCSCSFHLGLFHCLFGISRSTNHLDHAFAHLNQMALSLQVGLYVSEVQKRMSQSRGVGECLGWRREWGRY